MRHKLSERTAVRFHAEVAEALEKLARRKFTSESEIVRQAVIATLRNEGFALSEE
jgi:hypothetical protein